MKYGKIGACKGPTYSTGKTTSHTDRPLKVGRSEGLKTSHVTEHAAMSNKAGIKHSLAAVEKNRRGQ